MRSKVLIAAGILMLGFLAGAGPVSAQPLMPEFEGMWAVKYADGSKGSMTIDKDLIKLSVPVIGELKGRVEIRSDYFESILDRSRGINFIFGYLKSDAVEGKLQESAPCTELKKALKSGVTESSSTCQAAFTATKK